MKDWKKLIDVPMPKTGSVTDEAIVETRKNAHRFRGSTRISTGRIWADRDYEAWRKKVLNTPLP